jgi:hypothetical protein
MRTPSRRFTVVVAAGRMDPVGGAGGRALRRHSRDSVCREAGPALGDEGGRSASAAGLPWADGGDGRFASSEPVGCKRRGRKQPSAADNRGRAPTSGIAQIRACAPSARRDCFCPRAGTGLAIAMARSARGQPSSAAAKAAIAFVQERALSGSAADALSAGWEVAKSRCGGLTTADTCFCVGAVIDCPASTVLTSFG